MSLAELASESLKGFDPKTSSLTGNEQLPTGKYNTIVNKIEHRVYKSGYECMVFSFKVVDGEYASRVEFVNISLAEVSTKGNPIPDFIISRNIKTIQKIAVLTGVQLDWASYTGNETDTYEKMAPAFKSAEGMEIGLEIQESPNRKDPSNPYRNYDFFESELQIETPQPTAPMPSAPQGPTNQTTANPNQPMWHPQDERAGQQPQQNQQVFKDEPKELGNVPF